MKNTRNYYGFCLSQPIICQFANQPKLEICTNKGLFEGRLNMFKKTRKKTHSESSTTLYIHFWAVFSVYVFLPRIFDIFSRNWLCLVNYRPRGLWVLNFWNMQVIQSGLYLLHFEIISNIFDTRHGSIEHKTEGKLWTVNVIWCLTCCIQMIKHKYSIIVKNTFPDFWAD